MRVALFTDTWLPQVNGVSRTLDRLVQHLTGRGNEVALISPRIPGRDSTSAAQPFIHIELPGVPVPMYPELLFSAPLGRSNRAVLDTFNPAVVHCATESTVGWAGRRWALKSGRPLVTSFHTNFPEYAAGYGLGFLAPTAWRLLRRFHEASFRTLCPSSTTRAELQSRGFHDRIRIWPRGVDCDRFSPSHRSLSRREELAPGAQVVVLYVGRLAAEKRLDILMDAFKRVRERSPVRVALVLVGDGPMRASLQGRRDPDVHLTGFLKGEELAKAYAAADIFAFPSDTETFGNVVTEAMASGLPVVGVNRGGVRDLILPDRTGRLVPPDDPDSFAAALLSLVYSPINRARMGHAGRLDACQRDWCAILDGVVSTYHEAAEGAGRPVASPRNGSRVIA